MSGVLARFPLLLPVRNSFASYGASVVTRTRGRGHVAEVKTNFHRVGAGFPLLTPTMQVGKDSHVIIYIARREIQGDD